MCTKLWHPVFFITRAFVLRGMEYDLYGAYFVFSRLSCSLHASVSATFSHGTSIAMELDTAHEITRCRLFFAIFRTHVYLFHNSLTFVTASAGNFSGADSSTKEM